MADRNDGGSAYPSFIEAFLLSAQGERFESPFTTSFRASPGKSLRDWFAGQALAGLIHRGFTELGNSESAYAALAYRYADAMLAERARERDDD